jgi:hypothetical protein
MPHSPFTRFLACVLVVLAALGLLWPDDRTFEWATYGTGAVAILLMIFTWSAVKSTPPLDDRAFHQCLPPGANNAFFRTIWIHLLVLSGVAIAMLVYCAVWNFSWRATSWGVVMLTVPAWALMSAVGVASSAGSSQQHWKSTAWFAILAMPLFSAGLLYWLNQGVQSHEPGVFYFTPLRTTVLTAATLYPLVWWLIAARKRRALGLLLGGATGALLPWLLTYGDFVKVPGNTNDDVFPPSAAAERLTLSRKPFAGSEQPWIPVEDLIDLQGLAEGEYTSVMMSVRTGNDHEREALQTFEIRDESHPEGNGLRYGWAVASKQDGKVVWGAGAVNQRIRSLLPAVETFEYWEPSLNRPASPPVVRNPAAPGLLLGDPTEERPYYRRISPEGFRSMPWSVWVQSPTTWKLLGTCLATEGTSFRLASGGVLKISPLVQSPEGKDSLSIRNYFEFPWQTKGPWFNPGVVRGHSGVGVQLVAVDESGRHAYLIDGLRSEGNTEKVMLGMYDRATFHVDVADSAAEWKRIEMLRKSRLYVFASQTTGFNRVVELPGL